MPYKLKDFFDINNSISDKKSIIQEGVISDFIQQLMMKIYNDDIEDASKYMKNDPELLKLVDNFQKSKDELKKALENDTTLKKWVIMHNLKK